MHSNLKKLAQDMKEKSAPGATEEGKASASRARKELRGRRVVGCMVIPCGIEELSVGPELNGFGQDASESVHRSAAYHRNILRLPTDESC